MKLGRPLATGTLVKRYKRFLADIELDNGEIITAHCANSGAMTSCAEPGRPVIISDSENPKRKLRFTWEQIKMVSFSQLFFCCTRMLWCCTIYASSCKSYDGI